MGWQSVMRSVVEVIRKYGVRLTVGMHAIPWPAPHTRPVEITAHSSEPSLLGLHQPWVGHVEIPGSFSALIELDLTQNKLPAMGYAAHVPHYLTGADYPSAAVRVIEELSATTGLMIPLDDLRARAEEADAEIGRQVSADPENAQVVTALERQLDGLLAARAAENAETPADLPTADEIAAQVERFLADLDR
jgi:predicted ATP-grasp superfamily ATP-dependent carboligase